MGGDEVDRGVGTPAALIEMIARGGEPAGQVGNLALLTHPEGPRGIPKTVVPFRPARRKTAHLVAPGTAVPGLGNELALAEYRVLAAGHQKAVALIVAMGMTGQDGRQIETEAVHLHFRCPVAQGVSDHLQHTGMAEIQGVTGARIRSEERRVGKEWRSGWARAE